MKDALLIIFGLLAGFTAFLGMIGGAIATRYWFVSLVILTILKWAGVVTLWFGGLFTLSAIGTPLWMLFGGLFMMGFNGLILIIMAAITDSL